MTGHRSCDGETYAFQIDIGGSVGGQCLPT
jgi:hypothetical protein